MKKLFTQVVLLSYLLILFVYLPHQPVFAQQPQSTATNVSARVGEFYLSVSGYAWPNAAITLAALDGTFMRSTIADSNGNFSISQVLIRAGFSGFCLSAIDPSNNNVSVCISVPPATSDIVITGIVLPPTSTVSQTGNTTTISGYTVPNSTVTITLSNGTTVTTTANNSGFYQVQLTNLPPGTKIVSITTTYKNQKSPAQQKLPDLNILTPGEQTIEQLKNIVPPVSKFPSLFLSLNWVVWLLLFLLLLLIIFFLIYRLWPEKVKRLIDSIFNRKKKQGMAL